MIGFNTGQISLRETVEWESQEKGTPRDSSIDSFFKDSMVLCQTNLKDVRNQK